MKVKIREQVLSLVLLLALCGWMALAMRPSGQIVSTAKPDIRAERTLIIDAGHGGEDGGAVSPNGTVESHINLAIALRVDALMGLFGMNSVLLRDSDVSLHDPDRSTIREKKVSDLRNRVASISAISDATVISIHQNMFSQPQYSGAQVFYRDTEVGLPLANLVRANLQAQIDPANQREVKKVPDTVYLMKNITCPAIIVECGFLSNPMEETYLRSEAYQTKLATVIAGSWLQYTQMNREGENPHAAQV